MQKGFITPRLLVGLVILGAVFAASVLFLKSSESKRASALQTNVLSGESLANMKGVQWHMGSWYDSSTGQYDKVGMKMDLDNMKVAGISWVRTTIDPNTCSVASLQNTGTCSLYDWLLVELKARGMNWQVTVMKKGAAPKDLGSEADRTIYKQWLGLIANRYKNDVKFWQIHNEPNIRHFWNIDENNATSSAYVQSVANYVQHLKDSQETLKAVDPNLQVLLGGLSQWKIDPFMNELISQGAEQYFDVFAIHPYSDTGPDGVINILNSAKAKMAPHDSWNQKPIWITELGYQFNEYPGFVTSEDQKAEYVIQTWHKLIENGITTPIMLYVYNFDNAANMVDVDKVSRTTTFRPSYYAYKNLWATPPSTPSVTPTASPSATPTPTPTPLPNVVNITNPLNGSLVTAGSYVDVTATAFSPSGISRIEFYINNSLKCSDTIAPYLCKWKVPAKPGASYLIMAKAYDSVGNTSSVTSLVKSAKPASKSN